MLLCNVYCSYLTKNAQFYSNFEVKRSIIRGKFINMEQCCWIYMNVKHIYAQLLLWGKDSVELTQNSLNLPNKRLSLATTVQNEVLWYLYQFTSFAKTSKYDPYSLMLMESLLLKELFQSFIYIPMSLKALLSPDCPFADNWILNFEPCYKVPDAPRHTYMFPELLLCA